MHVDQLIFKYKLLPRAHEREREEGRGGEMEEIVEGGMERERERERERETKERRQKRGGERDK